MTIKSAFGLILVFSGGVGLGFLVIGPKLQTAPPKPRQKPSDLVQHLPEQASGNSTPRESSPTPAPRPVVEPPDLGIGARVNEMPRTEVGITPIDSGTATSPGPTSASPTEIHPSEPPKEQPATPVGNPERVPRARNAVSTVFAGLRLGQQESSTPSPPQPKREQPRKPPPGSVAIPAGYHVQCGAFADEANAKRLSERLIEIGYPAYVAVAADKKLYRVMISTPRSRQEAEQMVAELTNWGYPARVVRN